MRRKKKSTYSVGAMRMTKRPRITNVTFCGQNKSGRGKKIKTRDPQIQPGVVSGTT